MLLGVVAVGLPFFLGLGAIVLSIRRDTSMFGAMVGAVGVVVAIVVGSVLANAGERMKPDPEKIEKPRPADCKVVTNDTSAINRTCTQEGFEGDCPTSYACNRTMAGLYGDKTKPQLACEILCTHDCMCPSGTTCRNATCQRGKDLPP